MKANQLQIEIDGIDKEILRHLMEDARKPILQIANSIGISGAAIHQRLKKLEEAQVISGSKFILNTKVLGYRTMAFVGIYLDKASSNSEA
ncbi:Lrp/AsnC family transcriptional regulator, partial [Flavobacterium sp.]